jgi:hypothetical protein
MTRREKVTLTLYLVGAAAGYAVMGAGMYYFVHAL